MNTITFGGVTSSTYDIYISGEGVWSAPERDAEVITIPGRNGAFVQDNGRFQNITVTYPAFIVKDNNTNFKTKIDGFRNAMASKVGYQRLVDTYHTDEYRMAAFIGGMEVEPILYNDHAATFDLVFECKPQRFLTSGETAVSVANNGTITNPTLFDSKPMLEVKGYGDIGIGNDTITVENAPIGMTKVHDSEKWPKPLVSYTIPIETEYANSGDEITFGGGAVQLQTTWKVASGHITGTYNETITGPGGCALGFSFDEKKRYFSLFYYLSDLLFNYGTSKTETLTFSCDLHTSAYGILTGSITLTLAYNGSDTFTFTRAITKPTQMTSSDSVMEISDIWLNSTKPALGNPLYIDLDIGEAYKIENNVPVSVNNGVYLPPGLITLKPGSNTITYDNTITSFKIVPRWWQV